LLTVGCIWLQCEGAKRFSENIQEMLGRQICILWTISWKFISPAFIIVSSIVALIEPLQHP